MQKKSVDSKEYRKESYRKYVGWDFQANSKSSVNLYNFICDMMIVYESVRLSCGYVTVCLENDTSAKIIFY